MPGNGPGRSPWRTRAEKPEAVSPQYAAACSREMHRGDTVAIRGRLLIGAMTASRAFRAGPKDGHSAARGALEGVHHRPDLRNGRLGATTAKA